MREAQSRELIAMTPIPKLDCLTSTSDAEPYATPLSRIPRVDESECVGCNLCYLVCPVKGCITMEEVDLKLPPESWEQRTASAPDSPITGRKCD